jgi:hypothetical protein
VAVDLAGTTVEIPALPAADWLGVLMADPLDPEDVFPGLLSQEEADQVEDFLFDELVSLDELDQIFLDVVGLVGARPWWVTMRLVAAARNGWAVLGPEMLRQVDATRVSLSGWLDVLLVTILRRIEPESATMFTLQLELPPASEAKRVEEELEMSPSAFMALAR